MGGDYLVWEGKENFHGFRNFCGFRRVDLVVAYRKTIIHTGFK